MRHAACGTQYAVFCAVCRMKNIKTYRKARRRPHAGRPEGASRPSREECSGPWEPPLPLPALRCFLLCSTAFTRTHGNCNLHHRRFASKNSMQSCRLFAEISELKKGYKRKLTENHGSLGRVTGTVLQCHKNDAKMLQKCCKNAAKSLRNSADKTQRS